MPGAQEPSPYNGHFESVRNHPLFLFNQGGDRLPATLQPGNLASPALKTLALPEFIRLRGGSRRRTRMCSGRPWTGTSGAAKGGDDGPEPEVSEDLLDHRRLLDKKTVNHRLAVLE